MSNQQLIKYAHICVLVVLLACGIVAAAVKAGIAIRDQNQNSNQNSNSNSNSNSNTNTNTNTQNRNANRSANRNSSNRNSSNTNAAGEQAGMANMSSQDRNFLMDAAMGGMLEVELGKLAVQKATSDAVKQFGQRMVDDHSKANQELMTLASGKGITLPTEMGEKHRGEMTKLQNMSGAQFDREYIKMMVNSHDKKASAFEKQSTRGADPDLKAFAAKTIPTIQEHLQMAKSLDTSQRGGNSNTNSSNRNNNGNSNRP